MNGRSAVGHDTDMTGHFEGIALKTVEGILAETAKLKDKAESRITAKVITCGLVIMIPIVNQERGPSAGACNQHSCSKKKIT